MLHISITFKLVPSCTNLGQMQNLISRNALKQKPGNAIEAKAKTRKDLLLLDVSGSS